MNDRARLARRAGRTLSSHPVDMNPWIRVRENHAETGRPEARRKPRKPPLCAQSFAFLDARGMVESGEIQDAMTIIAVLHAARGRGT